VVEFALVAAAAYLAMMVVMFVFQRQMTYFPDPVLPTPTEVGLGAMSVARLATEDGLDLVAWYRPAPEGRQTIAYFHGNGGHIGYRAERVRPYLAADYGVLLVEYRGYGGNPGRPAEAGLYRDGRAALAFLARAGVTPADTILYGESLGCAVALAMAAEARVGAIVLEAPFTSLPALAAHHYWWTPARWFVRDRFDNLARIAGVAAPVLVIHGEDDAVVPVEHGRRLFARAAEPKQARFIPGAGHEDLDAFGLHGLVLDFLSDHSPAGGPVP